jgi:chromosome partitioning protein
MKLSVINLKGGTGKTTSAMFLAAGLNRKGRTLLIDADPQGSALSWSESAKELPYPVIGLPVKDLQKRVPTFARDYEHIVIDTPPGEVAIVRSSLLAADTALITISQGLLDIDRLRPTLELLEEVEDFVTLDVNVLLTRVRKGTKSSKAAREILMELELDVLDAEITLLEVYANALGLVPDDLAEYSEVLEQLLKREDTNVTADGTVA